jgi:hypothetical protein
VEGFAKLKEISNSSMVQGIRAGFRKLKLQRQSVFGREDSKEHGLVDSRKRAFFSASAAFHESHD